MTEDVFSRAWFNRVVRKVVLRVLTKLLQFKKESGLPGRRKSKVFQDVKDIQEPKNDKKKRESVRSSSICMNSKRRIKVLGSNKPRSVDPVLKRCPMGHNS